MPINARELAAGTAALCLLVLAALTFHHPGKASPAPSRNPLEMQLRTCDRLPDLDKRASCWRDAYRKEHHP